MSGLRLPATVILPLDLGSTGEIDKAPAGLTLFASGLVAWFLVRTRPYPDVFCCELSETGDKLYDLTGPV